MKGDILDGGRLESHSPRPNIKQIGGDSNVDQLIIKQMDKGSVMPPTRGILLHGEGRAALGLPHYGHALKTSAPERSQK